MDIYIDIKNYIKKLENNIIKFNCKSLLFFLLGLFSTWSALIIQIGKSQIALYNIIIGLIILYIFREMILKKEFYFHLKGKIPFILFLCILPISTFLSLLFLKDKWFFDSIRGVIKFSLFIGPIFLLLDINQIKKYKTFFINGLYISALGQLIWEFLQMIVWANTRISLNELIFESLLGISCPGSSWTIMMHVDGISQFRPTGLGWDTSAMAFVLIIGFIISKKMYMKTFFSLGILLSTSRTGILCWGICIIICLLYTFLQKHTNIVKYIISIFYKRKYFYLIAFFIVILILILNFKDISQYVLFKYFTSNDNLGNFSAQRHLDYYLYIPLILSHSNILEILFGYGSFIAGYPYAVYVGFYKEIISWTPESDFITLLFGNGIVGLFIYYYIIFKALKNNIYNKQNFLIISLIAVAGIFYLYIRSSWTFLLLLFLFFGESKNKKGSLTYE